MQITADSIGVYTKVFSLSPYQNFDVIRQWSVEWCPMAGPSCLHAKLEIWQNQEIWVAFKFVIFDQPGHAKREIWQNKKNCVALKIVLKFKFFDHPGPAKC